MRNTALKLVAVAVPLLVSGVVFAGSASAGTTCASCHSVINTWSIPGPDEENGHGPDSVDPRNAADGIGWPGTNSLRLF